MFPSLYSQPTAPPSYDEVVGSNNSSDGLYNTSLPHGQSGNRNSTSYPHSQSGNQNTASYPYDQSGNRNSTSYPHGQSGNQNSTNYSQDQSANRNNTSYPQDQFSNRNSTSYPHGQSGNRNTASYPHDQSGNRNNTSYPQDQSSNRSRTGYPQNQSSNRNNTNYPDSQTGYQNNTNYSHGQSGNRNNTDYPHGQSGNQKHDASSDERTTSFEKFVRRYEINKTFAEKLRGLNGCEIVFICDDSGSMNTELGDVTGPSQEMPTRWDELKRTVSIVVDLASSLDPDGVDIFFLNREPMRNVRSSTELIPMFAVPPEGATPLSRVMRQILQEKRQQIQDRKLILLIATDGAPTDDEGYQNVEEFRYLLQHERRPIERIPVTIIACTDDDCMEYLNNWDKMIPNLDVVQNYKSERQQILQVQDKNFPFSFGDYIVKIIMGGIDPWFDDLDEKKVSLDVIRPNKTGGSFRPNHQ